MLPESPIAAALNHLLGAEPWARAQLAPHAGKALELRATLLPPLRLVVLEDGRLAPAETGTQPALAVTLGAGVLAAALRGEEHLLRAIQVEGDAELGAALMQLARHLRWDAEEDLSRWVGDAAAHRAMAGARTLAAWQLDAGRRIAEGVVEWALHEQRLLLARAELEAHAAGAARLRDGVERLEKRIDRLGG